jgi:hypothetical protein
VPNPEVAEQRKSRPKGLFNSILIIVDQTTIHAGFDSRRQAKAETLYMGMMPLGFAGGTRAPRGPV